MDVALGEMDGWEATQLIKANPLHRSRIPVIALTAHALESDRREERRVGCADFDTQAGRPGMRLLNKINGLSPLLLCHSVSGCLDRVFSNIFAYSQ